MPICYCCRRHTDNICCYSCMRYICVKCLVKVRLNKYIVGNFCKYCLENKPLYKLLF